MLKVMNIENKNIRLIQNLCYNQCAPVRVRNVETGDINVGKDVRKGRVLLPDHFNLYNENLSRVIEDLGQRLPT